ncbi:hypothetical protein [Microbacterium dauci]|uniref:Secreted protein n=1 Tax=Microbacterium dauci TaxID=3048008 RepID=A0ABT6ZAD3_9MICO|nr:hypothetical protein [Microbacterium sp. LX3-4]MDJ1113123.1 hypothetical protein [Microbacterium sp. LX3-4]
MNRIRSTAAAVAVASVLLLAACAPEPGSTPTVTPSESAVPSPSASPSPSPTASESSAPSPSPTAEPPVDTEMTAGQAGALCVAKHRDEPIEEGITQIGDPTAYERYVEPHWFVTVPAENEFGPLVQLCVLGGTVDAPVWQSVANVSADEVDDAYIERQRSTNEEF